MKRALVASIAKVEGVAQEKFSGAPPQTPSCFAPPIKNRGGATAHCHIIGSKKFSKAIEKIVDYLVATK